MIIAGIRPPGFDAARAERARRAADPSRSRQSEPPEDDAAEADPGETSAVRIAPRPPSD
jgi:hypothetical protein